MSGSIGKIFHKQRTGEKKSKLVLMQQQRSYSLSAPVQPNQMCYKEVQHAHVHNKRIVPILCGEIDEALVEKLHPAIQMHNCYSFIFFSICYYTWATIPAADLIGRARIEFGMGVAVTAGLIIAALALMGDELVMLRYRESLILRSGYGFVFSIVLGGSITGFLQAIYFGQRLEWLTVFIGAFSFGISIFLRTTFRLNARISFVIAFIAIFGSMYLTYATPETINTVWGGSRIPLYFFESTEQFYRLGIPMALLIAFGYYGFELVQSFVRQLPKEIRETQTIQAIMSE